jgi:hypothetical protein
VLFTHRSLSTSERQRAHVYHWTVTNKYLIQNSWNKSNRQWYTCTIHDRFEACIQQEKQYDMCRRQFYNSSCEQIRSLSSNVRSFVLVFLDIVFVTVETTISSRRSTMARATCCIVRKIVSLSLFSISLSLPSFVRLYVWDSNQLIRLCTTTIDRRSLNIHRILRWFFFFFVRLSRLIFDDKSTVDYRCSSG